jgi:microcystin-dependent protein
MPLHTHVLNGSSAQANVSDPATINGNLLLGKAPQALYANASALVPMIASAVANTGGSQAHLNMQPFLTLTFCIALQGIFPSQN